LLVVLQGKVNLEQEVAKIQKKVDLAQGSATKMRTAQEQPDYATKIPQTVRDANVDKVSLSKPFPPFSVTSTDHLITHLLIFIPAASARLGDREPQSIDGDVPGTEVEGERHEVI
jgi:hypothetical protein